MKDFARIFAYTLIICLAIYGAGMMTLIAILLIKGK